MPAVPDWLIRPLIYLAIGAALFCAGFIKGCQHEQAEYKEAEVKFTERVKVVREIERVEVPKLVTKIEWLHHTETQLIEAANAAPPNPAMCDLDAERVRRINQAATANPG